MNNEDFAFDVTADTYEQYVLGNSAHVPVLVDFWAPWCGPCKTLMPLLGKLATEYNGQFLLAKVNIDEQQELAMQFSVRSVPTVKLVRHGQVVDEFTGALPESQLRQFIEQYIERESDRQIPAILELFSRGEHAEALQQIARLRENETDNIKLLELQLQLLVEAGQLHQADELIQSLPENLQQEASIQAVSSGLKLKLAASEAPPIDELKQRLEADPANSEARYQLALQLTAMGDYEAALEAFLELLRRDRSYSDGAASKGMLMIFEQLGPADERVSHYRRRMFTVLH